MVKSSTGIIAEKQPGNSDCRFKGIRKRKWGKWVSEVRLPKSRERIWLGSYDTPEKAARAYDAAVFCLRGPKAKFNFPENPPGISAGSSLSAVEIQVLAAKHAHEGGSVAPDQPEQERSVSESPSPSSVSGDLLPLDLELDWSFMELLSTDSSANRTDFGSRSYFDQFPCDFAFPSLDFVEETGDMGFSQDLFLWNF